MKWIYSFTIFCIALLLASPALAACPGSTCTKNTSCDTGKCSGSTCAGTACTDCKTTTSKAACTPNFTPTVSGGKLLLKNTCTGAYTACYWKIVNPKGKVTISRECNPSVPLVKGSWYVYFSPKFVSCGWSKDIAKRFTVK